MKFRSRSMKLKIHLLQYNTGNIMKTIKISFCLTLRSEQTYSLKNFFGCVEILSLPTLLSNKKRITILQTIMLGRLQSNLEIFMWWIPSWQLNSRFPELNNRKLSRRLVVNIFWWLFEVFFLVKVPFSILIASLEIVAMVRILLHLICSLEQKMGQVLSLLLKIFS